MPWTRVGETIKKTVGADGHESKTPVTDYLRKLMPQIDFDAAPEPKPPRKHWKIIIGSDLAWFKDWIERYQNSVEYRGDHCDNPGDNWGKWFSKQPMEERELWKRLLHELVAHGWFAPQIRGGMLSFGSAYPVERRRVYKSMDEIVDEADNHSQGVQGDFIKERQPGDDSDHEEARP